MTAKTRDRLLDAAAQVFATHGYRDATIQRIAELAEANIAAVNYHFGGKAPLCAAVIARQFERRAGELAMPHLADAPDDPEGQLTAFVRWFARVVLASKMDGLAMRLMPELPHLGEVADAIVAAVVRPVHEGLAEIVAALLPDGTSTAEVRRSVNGILGQVLIYRHGKPMLGRVYPDLVLDEAEAEAIGEHVARFSLAGLHALAAEGQRS